MKKATLITAGVILTAVAVIFGYVLYEVETRRITFENRGLRIG